MTTDIIEINNFVVLTDSTDAKEAEVYQCQFDQEMIGISFYDSGNVKIKVEYSDGQQTLESSKGMAMSFYGDNTVKFSHQIDQKEPLHSVSIFSTVEHINQLQDQEKSLFVTYLSNLLHSPNAFELGAKVTMNAEMHLTISKIFQTPFQNSTRLLFLKSQVLELLSHYFSQIEEKPKVLFTEEDQEQLFKAKEIILQNMNKPPTLSELSKLVGMNNNKLNKNFKMLFGVPVFKYLQLQRLSKAYQLLKDNNMTVQEVAWFVGYDSLSSFSNAFQKQYGCRPSAMMI
ncbi:AraC family transcriptional regulator [Flammeovirga sp. EKP202]|uniref:helix-turn-helix domain-containing protein n=1 Tax=Flammeovirga sp. EKP202 TaxID=2770592 RepID=UPI00165F5CA2|nr:AraC family transcriptional regulator [Flammeovirga sp. EKP202]MBD0402148.1 helix-turn-helix transcriptional regulator [Flammeovirga sp. EKP202]